MRIQVEFYDLLRELAGVHEWTPEAAPPVTVGELWNLARQTFPALSGYPTEPVFTAGFDFISASHVVRAGETISILPAPPSVGTE